MGSMDSIGHDVTPGNVASPEVRIMGGPTARNYQPDNDSVPS